MNTYLNLSLSVFSLVYILPFTAFILSAEWTYNGSENYNKGKWYRNQIRERGGRGEKGSEREGERDRFNADGSVQIHFSKPSL